MGMSDRAMHILFFDIVFGGLLAVYDASFSATPTLLTGLVAEITQPPPHVTYAAGTALNPFAILIGLAQLLGYASLELMLIALLIFVVVPITAVPGVPFANFVFLAFQIFLAVWVWTLIKPFGSAPS